MLFINPSIPSKDYPDETKAKNGFMGQIKQITGHHFLNS